MRSQRTIPLARRLRKTMTPPEVLLWLRLRAFCPAGPRFAGSTPSDLTCSIFTVRRPIWRWKWTATFTARATFLNEMNAETRG